MRWPTRCGTGCATNHVVVGSLLTAHAHGRPEQEGFVREMIVRLNALGIAQTMTAREGATCALAELVPALIEPYATPDCPIAIAAMPTAALDRPLADALALVLGELAANSTKHGALSGQGRVTLSGALADGALQLRWSERSDRMVMQRERSGGQGLRLMTRVLASRGGGIEMDWAENGLDAIVRVPAPEAG